MTFVVVRNGTTAVATKPRGSRFGTLLQGHLEWIGLSQSRLAERCEMDHSYISRLCSGGRMPGRAAAGLICQALELDDNEARALMAAAGFLVPGEVATRTALRPEVAALNDVINGLRPSEAAKAIALVDALTNLIGGER